MTIPMMIEVTKLIEKCPVCGDSTVGNGSKFMGWSLMESIIFCSNRIRKYRRTN